jgi:4-aminobutyrate aminotransferase
LTDADGNTFLDFLAGHSAVSVGYGRQDIIDAYSQSAAEIQHSCYPSSPNLYAIKLAEKLIQITPGDFDKRVLFGMSGSDSVDAAIKMARRYTGKPRIISFHSGYHGSTGLSLNANGFEELRQGLFLDGAFSKVNYPTSVKEEEQTLGEIENLLKTGDVAAVIVEPIQGDGGNIVPPDDFHQNLFALVHRYQALFIDDEVQAGVGRSGEWWEMQTFGVVPDILCCAKALASGYAPLSACIARTEIVQSLETVQHLFTFCGHGPSCAAGLKVLQIIEDEHLRENAVERGNQLKTGLQPLIQRYPCAHEVRGRGLHIGFEVRDAKTGQPLGGLFSFRCAEKGLYPGYCGNHRETMRLHPPLSINAEEIDFAIAIITSVVDEWETGRFPAETQTRYQTFAHGL